MPKSATPSASRMSARPRTAISRGLLLVLGELRRALRDERVALAHERAVGALADRHDDLAALAERVRDAALVADRDGRRPRPLAHAERVHVTAADVGALLDLAR